MPFLIFWIDCDQRSNVSCNGSVIHCGQSYESQCVMEYNSNQWFCEGQSCVTKNGLKITSFWTQTYYGIPMTIVAGIVVLCLFGMIAQIIRRKAKEKATDMLRYEVEDAMELEQSNVMKQWFKSVLTKVMGNAYNIVASDELYDDEVRERRMELANLQKMTKTEVYDSDDDLDLDGIVTGNASQTMRHSYGHTFASHDLYHLSHF